MSCWRRRSVLTRPLGGGAPGPCAKTGTEQRMRGSTAKTYLLIPRPPTFACRQYERLQFRVQALACLSSSLCNLCVLWVSLVIRNAAYNNHRDTENTEVAQRNLNWHFYAFLRLIYKG